MKLTLLAVAALVGIFGMTWLVEGNDFFLYKVFAPKREAVRREVYENTKSYTQGMRQELMNMQMSYIQADAEHKVALAYIIKRRAAEINPEDLTPELRSFIHSL